MDPLDDDETLEPGGAMGKATGGSSVMTGDAPPAFPCALMICTVAMPATPVLPSARGCAKVSGQAAMAKRGAPVTSDEWNVEPMGNA